jgi:DNA protecting protein DprA
MTIGSEAPGRPSRLMAASLPSCLGELSRPVAGLCYLGDPAALSGAPFRHVAIVGTREASPYGIRIAERLAGACARAGLVVVSGLARGVDAAAHRAALGVGGATIGVQGTGVDVPYPASHRALHQALTRGGTVLSEMEPGSLATPGCFPRRNRIIAALCQVTVVVEAGYKSGAINTATQALELGRIVAAVPGRIDEERSMGSNQLIRDGAQVIGDVDDLLNLFELSTASRRARAGDSETDGGDDSVGTSGGVRHRDRAPLDGSAPDEIADGAGASFRRYASELLDSEFDGSVSRDGLEYRRTERR